MMSKAVSDGSPSKPGNALAQRLVEFRFASIHRHIPALHATAQLNLAICIYVMWRQGIDPLLYAWTPLLAAFSVWRVGQWTRLKSGKGALAPETMYRTLAGIAAAALGSVAFVSIFAAATFAMRTFEATVIIPVSLAFGSFAIAHCMASMRNAAIATIMIGVIPGAAAMLLTGGFEARVLSVTMLSVAALNIGFVREFHRGMVTRLELVGEIERMADHDPLTGLLNRRSFFTGLDEAIARAEPFVLAVLDLDGFKQLNDTRGHLVGDAALQSVARRLAAHGRAGDPIGRLGGDEFVMLIQLPLEGAAVEALFGDLLARLEAPATIGGMTIRTPGSIGFASYPEDGATGDELYAAADAALYAAKRAGKGRSVRGGEMLRGPTHS